MERILIFVIADRDAVALQYKQNSLHFHRKMFMQKRQKCFVQQILALVC